MKRPAIAYGLWPALVLAFAGVASVAPRAGPLGFGLVAFVIAVTLLGVERLRPLLRDGGTLRDPQFPYDIGHSLVANGLGQLADTGALFVGALIAGSARELWGMHLWPSHWPLPAQGVLAIVLADGLDYWRHRLLHRVAWLWPIHALHHSIDRLHVLKGARNTFVDMASRSVAVFGPLAAAGAPAEALVWFPLAILVLGPIAHANVDLRFPAILHRLLVTPPQHRLHHAKDASLSDGNFAVVTPLWDVLFGTFRDPARHPTPAVGIEADPIPARFLTQVFSPFLWHRLARG